MAFKVKRSGKIDYRGQGPFLDYLVNLNKWLKQIGYIGDTKRRYLSPETRRIRDIWKECEVLFHKTQSK